ncbi:MAG TPA: alpha-glucuronidase family glycosyl hydrolase [Terriglobia bacterium]|nr:alpha-glucuronidase family glycosyl hydrolase [Terriglobia bacterium]
MTSERFLPGRKVPQSDVVSFRRPICNRAAGLVAAYLLATFIFAPPTARAETGTAAWLRYHSIQDPAARRRYDTLPATVVAPDDSAVIQAARQELIRGVRGMLGRTLRAQSQLPRESAIVLGTLQQVNAVLPGLRLRAGLADDGYLLKTAGAGGFRYLIITAPNDRGVLYGVFALLRKISLRKPIARLDERHAPYAPLRWVNEWDNLDGTIERGYGGGSIFFADGRVVDDLSRARDYARLLASVGINGCAVNNVNANPRVIDADFLPQLARLARAFQPWGVRLAVSIDLSSPQVLGGLDTFDPLDPRVARWWRDKFDEIYRAVPNFGGVVMKADSEGRAGPSVYGRSPVDAANVIARALRPHGGIIFYRAFVYDHHLDWRNLKNDRARAAYDIFHPLDGQFDDNVVLQIKNGPIDFQVREPASPLFGGLQKTNQAMEVQITQEYTGQQRHLCFLVPMWKEVLDFDMRATGGVTPVKDLIAGKTFHRRLGGMVGVANVGRDPTWLGSHLSMANLYGFGRLAWNPNLTAKQIAEEWTRQAFGNDTRVASTITDMQLRSWRIYENYTGPLGLGTLTDILGSHYGPGIESAERNGWGQWIRADHEGIGMDRSVATGTGLIRQYAPPVAKLYESPGICPDELLLFMHHVPYTHILHSGKTVIQYIYDTHYEGAKEAAGLVKQWRSLRGRVDEERYREVLGRLQYQAGHAIVWRDAVCRWFQRLSGIPDASGRVGNYPGRIEAETMKLEGYQITPVVPWETASGGQAVTCPRPSGCTATFVFNGKAGWHNLSVQYFDQNNGISHYKIFVAGQLVDHWTADMNLPADTMNGSSSTRRTVRAVALRPGDDIRIEGIPDREEFAPIDYIEIIPIEQLP